MNLKFILQNIDKVKNGLEAKGVKVDIDKLIELDKQRKEILPKIEEIRAKQNKISGKPKEKEIYQLQELKKERIDWENKLKKIEKEIEEILSLVPNLPLESVPRGKSEKDNRILRKVGKIKNFSFTPKNYLEIGEENIDTERAAKISGTRFAFLKGDLVRLQFALIRFVLDFLSDKKNFEKKVGK